ncbi:hypothetical protein DFR67_102228 [Williamsia limnetica]|uniref:Transmembrane protein n=1 Tax=Williamsia limnetica TaxID=882452 RepID=A0A318RUQ2_WILLI|nr:hypothetical protein [Williamsia limnetica]PYE20090.1 hypothetical protein DFR67_102228 [Williamsia limnetica]
MSTTPVDPAVPPKLVTRAYWLWMAAGVLLAVYGLAIIIVSLVASGAGFVVFGVFFAAIGAGLIVLARKAFPGDPRWRSALAVFTLMLVALGVLASLLVAQVAAAPLLFSLFALVGSMMAYRPSAEPWFAEK